MVARLDNWPILLSKYLLSKRDVPFSVKEHDCMSFVAGAVKATTGHDFFKEYCDYDCAHTALVMLETNGGCSGIISACLGHKGTRDLSTAQRGDVVLAKLAHTDGRIYPIGGIVDDSGLYFCAVTSAGLERHPIKNAWRVWSY